MGGGGWRVHAGFIVGCRFIRGVGWGDGVFILASL